VFLLDPGYYNNALYQLLLCRSEWGINPSVYVEKGSVKGPHICSGDVLDPSALEDPL